MSDNPVEVEEKAPDAQDALSQALRAIGTASSTADIIAALRQHIAPDVDRIALVRVRPGMAGKPEFYPEAMWDRDYPDLDVEFPSKIHELVADQPLVVMDTIYLDEFLAPLKVYAVDGLKATSFAIFPLILREETSGYLVIVTRQTSLNQDNTVRALLLLVWQISLAMENLALKQGLSQQSSRFDMVRDLLRKAAGTAQRGALGKVVAEALQKVLPIAHVSIALNRADSDEFDLTTWYGPLLSAHTTFNGSLIQQALKSRETVLVDRLPYGGEAETKGGKADHFDKFVVAPMWGRDEPIGTLNVGLSGVGTFTAEDRRLCEEVAAQLGITLSNVAALEHMQATLQETTALYSTTLALNAAQSLDEIYTTALTEMASIGKADRITLYVGGPDPRERVDYVEAVATWKGDKILASQKTMRFPLAEAPILGQFPQSRSNLTFNDIRTDLRLSEDIRAYYTSENVSAVLVVPLSTSVLWLGAALIEAQHGQTFSDEQARLCRSLADQTAMAVHAQMLVERSVRHATREQTLREVSELIRQAKSVDEILAITSEELSKVITGIAPTKLKTINLSDSVRMKLSREDLNFIESVQNQVSLAIENLKLLDTTRDAVLQEQGLRDIASAMNSTLELDKVLELVLNNVGKVLPHDAANIQFIEGGMARVVSSTGFEKQGADLSKLSELAIPVAETETFRQMIQSLQPYIVSDVPTYPGWVRTEENKWVGSYIGAPIFVEDDVIGFLNLNSASVGYYTQAHGERLQAFANQAAIAIRNAQAYQSTRLQAEVMGSITSELQRAAGVEGVLETAAQTLSESLTDYDIKVRLKPAPAAAPGAGSGAAHRATE